MKLTQRDKKLLIGLGIFIFTVVFIKFLILPKINNISTLKADIASLNNTYNVNMTYKAKTESLDNQIKILSQKLKVLRATYPPSINSDELLIILRQLIKESKLTVSSMSFDDPRPIGSTEENPATTVDQSSGAQTTSEVKQSDNASMNSIAGANPISSIQNYFYLWGLLSQQADSKTEAIVIPDGKGYSVGVKIEASGTSEQIKAFFDKLYKLNNKAICNSMSITQLSGKNSTGEGNELKLTTEISFLGIMDKGAGEYYLLKDGYWTPKDAADKADMFKEYSGYIETVIENLFDSFETTSKEKATVSTQPDYDFAVISSAYGGGLAPSVSITCKQPKENTFYSSPVVYGDSKGIENAEIFIEQKAGRYYCKFKTDHEAYPDKQYSGTFEFVPTGKDLRITILSSERKDDKDLAGLNLNIINNTNKKLIYEIKGDDKLSPRVRIGSTAGSVENEAK